MAGVAGSLRKNLIIIGLMLIAVAVFELHPAVKYWRMVVHENVYVGKTCNCDCIAESRPWYSRFNYWFWLWIIATPLIVFSVKPATPRWQRALRTVIAIGFCYVAMNFALNLMWDIGNGPFVVSSDPNFPWQKTWDIPDCANVADGASIVFMVFFGWIYAVIYTGLWEMLWYRYHKRKTKLLEKEFRRDWISKIAAVIAKYITLLILLVIVLIPFALIGIYSLQMLGIIK